MRRNLHCCETRKSVAAVLPRPIGHADFLVLTCLWFVVPLPYLSMAVVHNLFIYRIAIVITLVLYNCDWILSSPQTIWEKTSARRTPPPVLTSSLFPGAGLLSAHESLQIFPIHISGIIGPYQISKCSDMHIGSLVRIPVQDHFCGGCFKGATYLRMNLERSLVGMLMIRSQPEYVYSKRSVKILVASGMTKASDREKEEQKGSNVPRHT